MRPNIRKMYNGRWECMIPEDQVPDDNATDADWYAYTAYGIGSTPVGAYHNWLEDGGVFKQ